MTTTLRPGDRVRATVEATVADVNRQGEPRFNTDGETCWRARTSENWTFEILPRIPVVGDVIPRNDVNNHSWQDGAVLRSTRPNAPVHRAGGEWWFGTRGVFIHDFPEGTVFEVLAVEA